MVYTNQAIKKISQLNFIFSPHFLPLLRKFKLSVKFRGLGILNFNSQILPIKFSYFVFNFLKVCIDNVFYVNVSSVGVFFSNLFRFNEMGCFK